MPSQIDQLFEAYGAPTLNQGFGVSVVLKRGRDSSAAFTTTWTDQKYEVFDADGQLMTEFVSRDFMFAVTDVVLNGSTVEPRKGDQLIVEGTDKFELLPVGKMPAAEKSPGDYRWMVHTKKVV